MPNPVLNRHIRLMATTSAIALAITAAPLGIPTAENMSFVASAQADSCCFVGETLVLMANGRSCPIAKIPVGAFVMGMDGSANRVLRVERVRLGRRSLYALNRGRPFVTADHPFMTKQGWKSINPDAAGRERWTLEITALRPGNRVARARVMVGFPRVDGNVVYAAEPEVELKFETITSIDPSAADPELTVYNLILNGSHTYFADGYLVHNKNPGAESDSEGNGSQGQGNSAQGSNGQGSNGQGNGGQGNDGQSESSAGGSAAGGADGAGSGDEGGASGATGASGAGNAGPSDGTDGTEGGGASGSAGQPTAGAVGADTDPPNAAPAAANGIADGVDPVGVASPTAADLLPATPPVASPPLRPPRPSAGQRYQIFGGDRSDPSALEQVGPDLTPDEEREMIERGWQ